MTDDRKCVILEALLKESLLVRKVPIMAENEFNRSLGNLAEKTGLPEEEIREVLVPLVKKMTDEMLASK